MTKNSSRYFQLSSLSELIKNTPKTRFSQSAGLIFLSDVHLGSFDKTTNDKIEKKLITLLKYCQKNQYTLILNGDLFDYWMEYPDWHPELGQELLKTFESYHNHYPSTLYITGNHDYWTLGYFEQLGFEVEHEYRLLEVDNQLVLLLHGDGLSDPRFDLPRSIFNRFIRSPMFTYLYRKIFYPQLGLTLMKYLSLVSNWVESEKSRNDSILEEWSRQLLNVTDLSAVICGHNHNSRVKSFSDGIYLNPGDFGTQNTLILYTNKQFELVKWINKELVPVDAE